MTICVWRPAIVIGCLIITFHSLSRGKSAMSLQYEVVYATISGGNSRVRVAQIWRKGDKMRVEYEEGTIVIWTGDPDYFLQFTPSTHSAIKAIRSKDFTPDEMRRFLEDMAHGVFVPEMGKAERVGQEIVQGLACDVLESTIELPSGAYKRKEWRYNLPGTQRSLVLRGIWQNNSEVDIVFEVKRLRMNENIPDSLFKLPRGTRVTELELDPSKFNFPQDRFH